MKISKSIVVLGGCALLTSGVVSAFVLLSPERTWQNTPTYIVDDRGSPSIGNGGGGGVSETIAAITSEDAWNGADGDTGSNVVNAEAGDVENNFTLGDNVPMLNFRDPTGQCTGSCLAATFTGFYERVGRGRSRTTRIVDADIVTNTAYDWETFGQPCNNEFFIEGVQVHEIGHGLGLGHSNVAGATMFPSVAACDNGPATTAADDNAGILALYGGDDPGGSCPSELGDVGASCTANNQCCSGKCRGKPGNKTCR